MNTADIHDIHDKYLQGLHLRRPPWDQSFRAASQTVGAHVPVRLEAGT